MIDHLALALLITVVAGCATAKMPESGPRQPENLIVTGCLIQDPSGKLLWSHPDGQCIFYPDGRFVGGGEHGVTLYSQDQKPIWHLDFLAHHMLAATQNGDILVLTSEMHDIKSAKPQFKTRKLISKAGYAQQLRGIPPDLLTQKFRVDKILRISSEGKVIAERSLYNDPDYPLSNLTGDFGRALTWYFPTPFEASHVNSIYEIGPNSSPLPAFKPGNIVINDLLNGIIMILDPTLKQIEWRLSMEVLGDPYIHDVHILPNGHLLFFRNIGLRSLVSSLEEVDPVTFYTTWKWVDPTRKLKVVHSGSVQALSDGRHLFAYPTQRKSWVKMLDAKNKIVWALDLTNHLDTNIQGSYALPVQSFLQHSRPL